MLTCTNQLEFLASVTELYSFCSLPDPTSPFQHLDDVFLDAFALSVVVFAISISMAKILAKKRNYEVDPNQVCILVLEIVHPNILMGQRLSCACNQSELVVLSLNVVVE